LLNDELSCPSGCLGIDQFVYWGAGEAFFLNGQVRFAFVVLNCFEEVRRVFQITTVSSRILIKPYL
jgi:hypothetical protein